MTFWHQIWSEAFAIGVIGNLVAATIWAIPALRSLHKKLDRQHLQRMAMQVQHHKEIKEKLDGIRN